MDNPAASSTQRLEMISDGVFAVAATLLVLDLHVPEVGTDALMGELIKLLPHALAFVLSFLIVVFYWTAHHVLLIRSRDRTVCCCGSTRCICFV